MGLDEMIFDPESRQLQSARLEHLLNFSDLLILLIAEPGLGRTQMLDSVRPEVSAVKPAWVTLKLDSACDVTHLLKALVAHLGLNCAPDNRARLSALHAYARALHQVGEKLRICIDDADYLTDNALELLINFSRVDESAPQVLLTGLPEFEQRFYERDFHQLVEDRLHVEHLMPLSSDESRQFIEAHLPENARISEAALRRAILEAQGRFSQLKEVTARLVDHPAAQRSVVSKLRWNRWFLGALSLVLAVLLTTLIYLVLPESPRETELPTDSTRLSIPIPEPTPATPGTEARMIAARSQLAERLAAQEERLRQDLPGQVAEPVQEPVPVQASTEPRAVEAPSPEPPNQPVESATPANDAPVTSPEQRPPQVEPVQTVVKETPPAAAPSTPEPKPAKPRRPAEVIEVMSWPERDLTVQLMAAREAQTAERFMRQYESINGLLLLQYARNGADRYVVVYRHFSNRDQAEAAVAKLPEALRGLNPWIRSVTGLQAELAAAYPL